MKKIRFILLCTILFYFNSTAKLSAQVIVGISISTYTAPPPLPMYSQPPCPTDGYLWVPGYWAYGDGGYFWVPGVWVIPPQMGYLWTPGYWGYSAGMYGFHTGYWGREVGYYGGINYGYGYGGNGYGGGRWEGNHFRYNTAVVNVNTTIIHDTYVDRTVVVNSDGRRTSYNGGSGGITARPTVQQQSAPVSHRMQATPQQVSHIRLASQDRNQFATSNNGRPPVTAMNTPGGNRYGSSGNASGARHTYTTPNPANVHAQPATGRQSQPAAPDHQASAPNRPTQNAIPQERHQEPQHYNPANQAYPQQPRSNPAQGGLDQQHRNPGQGAQQPQRSQHVNPGQGAQQQHNAPRQNVEQPHSKGH